MENAKKFAQDFLENNSNPGLLMFIVKDEGANNNIRFSSKLAQSVRSCFDWDSKDYPDTTIYTILEEISLLDPSFRVKELDDGGKVFQYLDSETDDTSSIDKVSEDKEDMPEEDIVEPEETVDSEEKDNSPELTEAQETTTITTPPKKTSLLGYSKNPDRLKEVAKTIYDKVGKSGSIKRIELTKAIQKLDAWSGARANLVGKVLAGMTSSDVIKKVGKDKKYYALTKVGKKFLAGASLEDAKEQIEQEGVSPVLIKRARILFKQFGFKEFLKREVTISLLGVAYSTLGFNLSHLKKAGILCKKQKRRVWFFQREDLVEKGVFTHDEIDDIITKLEKPIEPEINETDLTIHREETAPESQPELEPVSETIDTELKEEDIPTSVEKLQAEIAEEKPIESEPELPKTKEPISDTTTTELPKKQTPKQPIFTLSFKTQELDDRERELERELKIIRESKTITAELSDHFEGFDVFIENHSDLLAFFPEIANTIVTQYHAMINNFQSKYGTSDN